jgi:hypothetical protein
MFKDSNATLPHGFHLPCMLLGPWPSDYIAFTSSLHVSILLVFSAACDEPCLYYHLPRVNMTCVSEPDTTET